ncbi:3-oxoacyl-reductase [Phaeosphaeriaceae sp. PMI808]|nr:3-oxoacyl-reductase [Phaeosphaeriaceae sp. PMI808]
MTARPRHALITGGSRGIGLAIAQLLSKNGYRCTLVSRSEEDLKAAVSTLQPLPAPRTSLETHKSLNSSPSTEPSPEQQQKPLSPHHHGYIPGDITATAVFWNFDIPSSFGTFLPRPSESSPSSKIDVLVNCAGITQKGLFLKMTDQYMDKIIQTNLTSLMMGTRFLLRQGYIRGQRTKPGEIGKPGDFTPVIINVASLLGIRGGYGAVAYAASKAGVLGFTRGLATEYASHRVRVNTIVPGYIETEMTRDLDESFLLRSIPLQRLGQPDEIAHAALFLAENQYAHNCTVNLDGGLSAI